MFRRRNILSNSDADIFADSERRKQDHIIQLKAQISKQRQSLDKMKSDFNLAQRTYHHLGDVLDNNTHLTEIPKMLLRSRKEDALHVMRQTNTIQQQMLEAKILEWRGRWNYYLQKRHETEMGWVR